MVEVMNINLYELRDYLVNKDRTLTLVKAFIEKSFEDLENNDANKILRYWSNVSMETNVQRIFETAESEIEKIFLNSLNLSAFLHDPFLIVFTPRFDSATEATEFFRERDNQIMEFQRQFEHHSGKKGHKEFTDWIEHATNMSEDEKMTIRTHVIMYHDLGLQNAYHLSVQATFKDIKVNNKYIRPDMFIWVPSNPKFKLVVECDGFDYHSDKIAFSRDRVRDRILQGRGFQVLRFSGSEILNDPVRKSVELCEYLINRKQEDASDT